MAIKLGGGGGSASQINEVVALNNTDNVVTLDDGRVYLKGGVFETTTSTYPLAHSATTYTGTSYYVGSQDIQPRDVTWDGTYFYVLGRQHDSVKKYNASGVYQNVSFSVASQEGQPNGITYDGSHLWVIGNATNKAFKYTTSGTYTGVFFSTSSETTSSGASSIAWDGTHFWVADWDTEEVYKYNSAGTYQNVSFSTSNEMGTNATITSLAFDGTYLWVNSSNLSKFFAYNLSGVYQNKYVDTSSLNENYPYGLGAAGSDLYFCGYGQDRLFKFEEAIGVQSDTSFNGQNYMRVA